MEPAELLKSASWLRTLLLDRIQLAAHQRAELARLDAAGRIYATPHWRDGRYLYLIYPTDGAGSRRREYVGADPDKIKAALAGVEHARQYDALRDDTRRLDALLAWVERELGTLAYRLEAAAPLDLATQATFPDGDNEPAPGLDSVANALDSAPLATQRVLEQLPLSPL